MKHAIVLVMFSSFLHAYGQTLQKEERALEDWLPTTIGEYKLDGEPLTVTSKLSNKPYSMSSKNYKKGTSVLIVVIFDYKDNPDLLKKSTESWSSIPGGDESKKTNNLTIEDMPAWESTDEKNHTAQLYVNVKGRYLLHLSVTGNTSEFLKTVAKALKLRQLPL